MRTALRQRRTGLRRWSRGGVGVFSSCRVWKLYIESEDTPGMSIVGPGSRDRVQAAQRLVSCEQACLGSQRVGVVASIDTGARLHSYRPVLYAYRVESLSNVHGTHLILLFIQSFDTHTFISAKAAGEAYIKSPAASTIVDSGPKQDSPKWLSAALRRRHLSLLIAHARRGNHTPDYHSPIAQSVVQHY